MATLANGDSGPRHEPVEADEAVLGVDSLTKASIPAERLYNTPNTHRYCRQNVSHFSRLRGSLRSSLILGAFRSTSSRSAFACSGVRVTLGLKKTISSDVTGHLVLLLEGPAQHRDASQHGDFPHGIGLFALDDSAQDNRIAAFHHEVSPEVSRVQNRRTEQCFARTNVEDSVRIRSATSSELLMCGVTSRMMPTSR